jgi:hypothetical protein
MKVVHRIAFAAKLTQMRRFLNATNETGTRAWSSEVH